VARPSAGQIAACDPEGGESQHNRPRAIPVPASVLATMKPPTPMNSPSIPRPATIPAETGISIAALRRAPRTQPDRSGQAATACHSRGLIARRTCFTSRTVRARAASCPE
jgi:hypothetical protein